MDYGLVSIIIPTYNRFNYLKKAIESASIQSYTNIEIIIINDGSTQTDYYEKQHEITSLSSKIIMIHLEENSRTKYNAQAAHGKTREVGIAASKGKWIAFLDDDDYWLPDKLKKQLDKLYELNDPNCVGCCSNAFKGHGSPNINALLTNSYELVNPYHSVSEFIKYNDIQNNNIIINPTTIVLKELFDKVGPFEIDLPEDYDYWLRTLRIQNSYFYYIDEPLIFYNIGHGDGIHYRFSKGVSK